MATPSRLVHAVALAPCWLAITTAVASLMRVKLGPATPSVPSPSYDSMHRLEQDRSPFANLTGAKNGSRSNGSLVKTVLTGSRNRISCLDRRSQAANRRSKDCARTSRPPMCISSDRLQHHPTKRPGKNEQTPWNAQYTLESTREVPSLLLLSRKPKMTSSPECVFPIRISCSMRPSKSPKARPGSVLQRDCRLDCAAGCRSTAGLGRCPEGQSKACFFQKHAGAGTPKTLRRFAIREKRQTIEYVVG